MRYLETLVNGEIVLIDIAEAWRETFAHWDALVDTKLAEDIANATEAVLLGASAERKLARVKGV